MDTNFIMEPNPHDWTFPVDIHCLKFHSKLGTKMIQIRGSQINTSVIFFGKNKSVLLNELVTCKQQYLLEYKLGKQNDFF